MGTIKIMQAFVLAAAGTWTKGGMRSMRRLQGRTREVFRCSEVFRSRVNTSFNANHLKSFHYFEPLRRCLGVWSRMVIGRTELI